LLRVRHGASETGSDVLPEGLDGPWWARDTIVEPLCITHKRAVDEESDESNPEDEIEGDGEDEAAVARRAREQRERRSKRRAERSARAKGVVVLKDVMKYNNFKGFEGMESDACPARHWF
jgi:hypothetical protein